MRTLDLPRARARPRFVIVLLSLISFVLLVIVLCPGYHQGSRALAESCRTGCPKPALRIIHCTVLYILTLLLSVCMIYKTE